MGIIGKDVCEAMISVLSKILSKVVSFIYLFTQRLGIKHLHYIHVTSSYLEACVPGRLAASARKKGSVPTCTARLFWPEVNYFRLVFLLQQQG